jgi:hypothetical protein
MELHGQATAQHEGLGRLRVPGDLGGCRRKLPTVVVPLEPRPGAYGVSSSERPRSIQLRRRRPRRRRVPGQQLAAEARRALARRLVGPARRSAQAAPRADPGVVMPRTTGRPSDDDVEVGWQRKLCLDVRAPNRA